MEKIGLFYGSDTGQTEELANYILDKWSEDALEVFNIADSKPEDFVPYTKIILGLSTWFDGDLQSDWEAFFEDHFKDIDFTGKTVAIFGLGDQYGYAEYFIDGVGIIGEAIMEQGGDLVGFWPTEGYEHETSKAEIEGDMFCGLAIDQDNQSDLTDERTDKWLEQIKEELGVAELVA